MYDEEPYDQEPYTDEEFGPVIGLSQAGGSPGQPSPQPGPRPGAQQSPQPDPAPHSVPDQGSAHTHQPSPAQAQAQPQPQAKAHAHAHPRALPWPEARLLASRTGRGLDPVTLPLDKALQHTLAEPLAALTDLPSFDTSAMDGWAVSGPGPWQVAEDASEHGILAGDRSEPRPLQDGHAVRIATGARVPPGTSAVLRSEYAELDGARLRTAHPPQPGTDIRPRGQECRSSDRLLPPGTRVTPAVLGLAAAAGYDELALVRRPRAEVLVLGDELLHRGLPKDGRIRDALGPMIGPWLTALGAEVLVTRRLGDDAEALHEAVSTTRADLVVTTGGTASGPVDHLHPTLERIGARLLVDGVQVRPGHPMLLARLPEGAHLVGLPGNPLAALSGLVTLAEPLLRTLSDQGPAQDPCVPLSSEVHGHPRDTRLVPVTYAPAESLAHPLHYNGPAMLRGIATAGHLAAIPPGGARSGAGVPLLTLPW
ncbi:molybdopterin molybdotransferase MoeA [Streptomyces sp. ODS28]|uniref:molybdopterin molybdotransferase MoeA n=1 Tax=Streptomyces sp. ODS28 TaxID=3136688 RepID=UPI0031E79F0B